MDRLTTRSGTSRHTEPARALAELKAAIEQPDMSVVLLFCSPSYDLDALGVEIARAFPCPVIGCTSAGQIGRGGYQRGGISATSVASAHLSARPFLIAPMASARQRAAAMAATLRARPGPAVPGQRAFGLLFADGLSLAEEGLVATLFQSLGDVPIIGGSAGDDLEFRRTAVYWEGTFRSDAAVFTYFETTLPFAAFKLQHFAPTGRKLVITSADPSTRLVREINGLPAAQAYAGMLGLTAAGLDPAVFSAHPLILDIGGENYVRSIAHANADGSMTFFCAIDEGLVVSIAQGLDPLGALEHEFDRVASEIGRPALVIGCDCILRRLELEKRGLDDEVGTFLAERGVVGFSTYGEQFNAVHVNQTFTGLAIAG